MKDKLNDLADRLSSMRNQHAASDGKLRVFAIPVLIVLLLLGLIGIYWSDEPEPFDIVQAAEEHAPVTESRLTTGSYTTSAVITAMETLLDKRGGYLSNDIMPPSIWLDNIPNWEFGVLVQMRDMSRSLRNDFSRSQSQSVEDEDLIVTEPKFHFDNNSWFLPASENVYQEGIDALYGYLRRLQDPENPDAQFYARADNLRTWLGQVETRLGSMSQRLSASVGQVRLNTDLAGDAEAVQSTQTSKQLEVKTPWTEIDDVFYEARGAAWAGANPFVQGGGSRFRTCPAEKERANQPAPDNPRAGVDPGRSLESGHLERQRIRPVRQPFAGDGVLYLPRQRRRHRPAQPAVAGLGSCQSHPAARS
jgi:hypothetical protein